MSGELVSFFSHFSWEVRQIPNHFHKRFKLTFLPDTPWDQSTAQSSEFCQYITGEIFDEPPWNRLETEALCKRDHALSYQCALICPPALICGLLTIEPEKRLTLAEVFAHPWCIRPSQIAKQGVVALADHLTESLRMNGDLKYAIPDVAISGYVLRIIIMRLIFTSICSETRKDKDGDEIMLSATHQSQFTQSLLLFVCLPSIHILVLF
jgi:serine/threonine-protein kinase Chk1